MSLLARCGCDEGWIILSDVDGITLYESLLIGKSGIKQIRDFGCLIRQLHELGISHGDLTTHNVIIDDSEIDTY